MGSGRHCGFSLRGAAAEPGRNSLHRVRVRLCTLAHGTVALHCTALHCTALAAFGLCSAACSRSEKTSLLVLREQIVAASAIDLGRRTETAKLRQEVRGTRSHVAVAQQGVRGHCAAE
jgi:hypothetical protein